jgi:molybdopterin-guanine dinucleotide biosynthesis protein A
METSIAILAGGKSRRMGLNKSLLLINNERCIDRILKTVDGLSDDIIIIANDVAVYDSLDIPIYQDIIADKGPLGGIYTALTKCHHKRVLILAGDMPLIRRDFIQYMLMHRTEADVFIPAPGGAWEPLHAIYSRACMACIEARLTKSKLKIVDLFEEVSIETIKDEDMRPFGAASAMFLNMNTVEDWRKLNELAIQLAAGNC